MMQTDGLKQLSQKEEDIYACVYVYIYLSLDVKGQPSLT